LTLVLIFFCNCGGKNQIISREVIEKVFVTKKDAMLYNDSFERIVIDEIPAFIRVKTLEKILILDKSENEKTYYKTIFNKKEGWVESKYLAETKIELNIKEDAKEITKIDDKPKTQLTKDKKNATINKQTGNYYVQIASFKNEINAKRLYNNIKYKNFGLSLEKINSSKGLHFRVITEKYKTKKDAESTLMKIKNINVQLNPIIKTNVNIKKTKISKSASKTKNGKTEYYTIQLSSFEDKGSAEKFAKKMTELGYPSRVTEAWVKGKIWFRVQHGQYKMITTAKQVSIKLKNKYKFNPWISNIYK
tara:strand:- start:5100 stop:6014 length:915 start_codon:yes stop_codon:yes gene_type:complete